jgi:hypothetical protein
LEHRVKKLKLENALATLGAEVVELETLVEDRLGRMVESVEV